PTGRRSPRCGTCCRRRTGAGWKKRKRKKGAPEARLRTRQRLRARDGRRGRGRRGKRRCAVGDETQAALVAERGCRVLAFLLVQRGQLAVGLRRGAHGDGLIEVAARLAPQAVPAREAPEGK